MNKRAPSMPGSTRRGRQEPRFIYVQISEREARIRLDSGEKVFVHPFTPALMERFIPGSMPVQVQMAESGARLQPEMYFKVVENA